MKKLTKKQETALKHFLIDIDELDNKPRRFFSGVRDIAENFIDKEKDKEHYYNVLAYIEEFQEMYYTQIRMPTLAEYLLRHARNTKRELISTVKRKEGWRDYWTEDRVSGYEEGVKDATKLLTKKFLEEIIDENT
jgi:hypothetical protein